MVKFLSSEFLQQYEGVRPINAGPLFEVMYLRSYCQYLVEQKRRETWAEVVERVVNYSMSLYQGPATRQELVTEAEEIYDNIFNLRYLPAGRTLWVGGTDSIRKTPEKAFNCCFCVITCLEDFCDSFHLLLCGCGVGFRVLPDDVENLPKLRSDFYTEYKEYIPKQRKERLECTSLHYDDQLYTLEIGDSKEAWVDALRKFLNLLAYSEDINLNLRFIFDSIRPEKERISSGGRAPGPNGMLDMFKSLEKLIKEYSGNLSSTVCVDLLNLVAKNVIVGGTRRSSEIALGSPQDEAFINLKKDMWKEKKNLHRAMSNNSMVFTSKPTKEFLNNVFDKIVIEGEPGFFNLEAANKRAPGRKGTNPCSEISLDSYGVCNLCSLNLKAFEQNGSLNVSKIIEALRMLVRIGLRQTNVTMTLDKWDRTQKQDRLLGVSMMGIMDTYDAINMDVNSKESKDMLTMFKQVCRDEARKYAFEMRVPEPLLITCEKPDGSLSKLPGVSSGVHRSPGSQYIRRIRVSNIDPVCKALQEIGVPNEPDLGKPERIVFSFPIKTSAKINPYDESASDQLDRYLTFMRTFVEHNVSNTIYLSKDEQDVIVDKVYDNWDDIVGVAFLPKNTDVYPQLPEEVISEEEFEKINSIFPHDKLKDLPYIVDSYERSLESEPEEYEIIEDVCVSGQCPVR